MLNNPTKICACAECFEPARLRSKTCSRACADALRDGRPKPLPDGSSLLCKSGSGEIIVREAKVGRPRKFANNEARANYFTKEWNAKVRKTERHLGHAIHTAAQQPSAFVARMIEDILAVAGKRANQAQTNRVLDLGVDPAGNSLSSLLHSWHTTPYLLNPDRGVVVTYDCIQQHGHKKAFGVAGTIEKQNKALFHDHNFKSLTGPEVINAYLTAVYGVNAYSNNKNRHFNIVNRAYSVQFVEFMRENKLSPSAAKEQIARNIIGTNAKNYTPDHQLQVRFKDEPNTGAYSINIIKGCAHDSMTDFGKLCVETKPANAPINVWAKFNRKAA